ncbi:hypothetical protein B0H14DRAFT_3147252 [Mycena olivaceomarginata]|nr:hypothetical protein B0H14DRAFT_3147252 [Mycena olivaceomarginata]
MSSSQTLGPKLPVGIPRNLDSRARHLFKLLKHLPASVPLDPPDANSTYHFFLNPEDVADEGEMYALIVGLKWPSKPINFTGPSSYSRSTAKRLDTLKVFLKQNIKKNSLPDARGHQDRWVERLITVVSDSGAKIPPKRFATQLAEQNISNMLHRHLDIDSDKQTYLATPRKPSNVGLGKP